MRPQWPHFNLRLDGPLRADLPPADVEIVKARAGDPELVRWDARIGGRPRPADHAYWVREQRAVPLWFRRQSDIVGYGYRAHADAGLLGQVSSQEGAGPGRAVQAIPARIVAHRLDQGDLVRLVPARVPAAALLGHEGRQSPALKRSSQRWITPWSTRKRGAMVEIAWPHAESTMAWQRRTRSALVLARYVCVISSRSSTDDQWLVCARTTADQESGGRAGCAT